MAHFYQDKLTRPKSFNFASNVVDYWASQSPPPRAMLWVSSDQSQQRSLDFQHFSRQSHRTATLLKNMGIKQREKLIIIMPRLPEWWEMAVGAIRSGIVVCPATTLLVGKDIQFRCEGTGAAVFVGDETSVGKFLQVRKQCPTVRAVIQIGGNPQPGVTEYHKALKDIPSDVQFKQPSIKIEDASLIYFTSGTSGPPKMVMHNQISYPLALTLTGKHWLRLKPGQVYWNMSEQGWAKAAWSFFGTWNCGASIFIHDDREAFDPLRMLEILHRYPVTTLCAPPTIYRQLILQKSQDYLRNHPFKALEHCTGAGEPLNDEVIKVWKQMTNIEICDGYGQTETITLCGNFAWNPIRPGSMGKPMPSVPLHVVNENGGEASVDEEGDICVLVHRDGENIKESFFGLYDGYVNKEGIPELRKVEFPATKNGPAVTWYPTGDRATRDKDGYIWFVGRSDDVINSSSYRIGPFEVESTLKQHPSVVESAVVASPDESRGEVVKAFVVLTDEYAKSDHKKLTQELQDFCKANAAPYKYPRKIQFVDPNFLPKTISGKIKRNELKKAEWAQKTTSGKAKL